MQHTSLNRIKGFTIVETLTVALTLGVLMSGLFYALITGESSWSFNVAKAEVRSEVRRAVDWIAKDVRQTVSWDIGDDDNNASNTHIKFRQVTGYAPTVPGYDLDTNYIEYTYDADAQTITRCRRDASDNIIQTWTFNNIIQEPFKTREPTSGAEIGAEINVTPAALRQSGGRLIIKITAQKQVKGSLNATATLIEQVYIRNG